MHTDCLLSISAILSRGPFIPRCSFLSLHHSRNKLDPSTVNSAEDVCWLLQRYKRNRDTDRRQTLQEQTLFSHKANPMYDTTQTLTTTSSSRGDDFEVIRVPPGPTEALAPTKTLFPADPSRTYMPPVYTVRHSADALRQHAGVLYIVCVDPVLDARFTSNRLICARHRG